MNCVRRRLNRDGRVREKDKLSGPGPQSIGSGSESLSASNESRRLELQFPSKLNLSRRAGGGELSERRRAVDVAAEASELMPVKRVEEIGGELETDSLANREVLVNGNILV